MSPEPSGEQGGHNLVVGQRWFVATKVQRNDGRVVVKPPKGSRQSAVP